MDEIGKLYCSRNGWRLCRTVRKFAIDCRFVVLLEHCCHNHLAGQRILVSESSGLWVPSPQGGGLVVDQV